MRILINDEYGAPESAEFAALIERTFEATAELESLDPEAEVSLSFVDNETIRGLNDQYRGIDEPTDVLSFPQDDDLPLELPYILGDIVISLERAAEQAQEYGHGLEREVLYLAVHGLLHLIGYDHQTEEDKSAMRAREEEVLAKLGLGR
ncbi:MAG: rRNA maturation RNase YbeY [Firmicutes bacterium]|jgi:probable rRNA maturation factor|nr:rRNA maturation RNase YbeY [Bacillota bacterium]NLO65244.1 rRNA maturation RNase YbeY [Bacillota bacterium]